MVPNINTAPLPEVRVIDEKETELNVIDAEAPEMSGMLERENVVKDVDLAMNVPVDVREMMD